MEEEFLVVSDGKKLDKSKYCCHKCKRFGHFMAECRSYPTKTNWNTYERKTELKIVRDYCLKVGHKAPECRKKQKLKEKGKTIKNIEKEEDMENEFRMTPIHF